MSRFRSDNEFTVTTGRDGHRSFGEHDDRWAPRSQRGRGGGGKYRGRDNYGGRNKSGRGEGSDRESHRGGRDYLNRGPRGISKRGKSVHFNPRGARLDDDGDEMMGGDDSSSSRGRSRFIPYSARPKSRRGGRDRGDRGNTVRFEPVSDWYKVIIPYGKKHEKSLLLKTLLSLIDGSFEPIQFHYDYKNAVFHVNDSAAAKQIKMASKKATLPDGFKLLTVVTASRSPIPSSLKEDVKEKLKVVMSSRYDPATKLLDLTSLHTDESLTKDELYMSLSRPNVLMTITDIIKQHIPEMIGLILRTNKLHSLSGLKDLVESTPNLTNLDLSDNKTTAMIIDIQRHQVTRQLTNDGAVRKRFSKIVSLDGNVLPPTIKFDLDAVTTLPPTKGSYFSDENIKGLIVKFLREFYSLYDSDNRHPLINAYHDQAVFSLSASINGAIEYKQSSLHDYIPESRNIIKGTRNLDKNYRQLKQGKLVIVSQLCLLPKTNHDPNSFIVDVGLVSPNVMSFSVTGVFKESDSKVDKPPIRAFSRQFVAVPSGEGILITNDMLTITNALPEQQQNAFKTTGPTPSSSPVLANPPSLPGKMSLTATPSLPTDMSTSSVSSLQTNMSLTAPAASSIYTPQQQHMLQQFMLDSKMNLQFSAKCLEENMWNYEKAGQIFIELNKSGKIPPEAFIT
ncbi:hypothetical protein LOTGIDRAFT_232475 [Lottia gigantea]|uniref:NTF2 domain-containing protein n=1 Tax=Lottia gigantea TaxID=225164 RepID=V4AGD5_LOTGI|nr:hypothetical protein LOTGIDRAFT_232475 [Lottia gigantea]ESO94230.1 hypothetical protein LOTGIDRAFT_232475 [Lottia gigantea]